MVSKYIKRNRKGFLESLPEGSMPEEKWIREINKDPDESLKTALKNGLLKFLKKWGL